jgi:hypothetical protein
VPNDRKENRSHDERRLKRKRCSLRVSGVRRRGRSEGGLGKQAPCRPNHLLVERPRLRARLIPARLHPPTPLLQQPTPRSISFCDDAQTTRRLRPQRLQTTTTARRTNDFTLPSSSPDTTKTDSYLRRLSTHGTLSPLWTFPRPRPSAQERAHLPPPSSPFPCPDPPDLMCTSVHLLASRLRSLLLTLNPPLHPCPLLRLVQTKSSIAASPTPSTTFASSSPYFKAPSLPPPPTEARQRVLPPTRTLSSGRPNSASIRASSGSSFSGVSSTRRRGGGWASLGSRRKSGTTSSVRRSSFRLDQGGSWLVRAEETAELC